MANIRRMERLVTLCEEQYIYMNDTDGAGYEHFAKRIILIEWFGGGGFDLA